MIFAADHLQTRHIYLAYMVAVRLNSPIAHYEISAADFVTKPPSEENRERGEEMEAGAGFPVHHGGSLRYSALLGAVWRYSRGCSACRWARMFRRAQIPWPLCSSSHSRSAPFPRLHSKQSVQRLSSTLLPPLETGVM